MFNAFLQLLIAHIHDFFLVLSPVVYLNLKLSDST
jgi:hypothetical protein